MGAVTREWPRQARVHGGRVDHTVRPRTGDWWQMACGRLPVHRRDLDRALCGRPCPACAQKLSRDADPEAAAARAHDAAVGRRAACGQPPLPGTQPHPAHRAENASVGCVDRAAVDELRSQLELQRQLPFDRSWPYPTFADLVLAHGRLYPPAPWGRPDPQQPGRCFSAAHYWADRAGWTYCEGYALVPATMPFPAVEHAWCLTPDGLVADPALPDGYATLYWGLPLHDTYRHAHRRGENHDDAILTSGADPFLGPGTALRNGLPPDALHNAGVRA
jgi:hypothetical protein